MTPTKQTLENRFSYHSPTGTQPKRYERLRSAGLGLAMRIRELCPESREQDLAFMHLEQAVMWANAAIARNEEETPNPKDLDPLSYQPPRFKANLSATALGHLYNEIVPAYDLLQEQNAPPSMYCIVLDASLNHEAYGAGIKKFHNMKILWENIDQYRP